MKPHRAYFAPDVVLKLISGQDKKVLDKLVQLKGRADVQAVTSKFSIVEAIHCLEKDEVDWDAFRKFMLVIEIIDLDVKDLAGPEFDEAPDEERKKHLRKVAGLSNG